MSADPADGRSQWAREFRARAAEMRASELRESMPKLKARAAFDNDIELFEAAMYALLNSDLPHDNWEPNAAPGFAALLVRIAEQTAAEFGDRAAGEAFRAIGEDLERRQ